MSPHLPLLQDPPSPGNPGPGFSHQSHLPFLGCRIDGITKYSLCFRGVSFHPAWLFGDLSMLFVLTVQDLSLLSDGPRVNTLSMSSLLPAERCSGHKCSCCGHVCVPSDGHVFPFRQCKHRGMKWLDPTDRTPNLKKKFQTLSPNRGAMLRPHRCYTRLSLSLLPHGTRRGWSL